jgi:DNA polymerase delta subunit 1
MADELPAKRLKTSDFGFDNSFDKSFEDELADLESEEKRRTGPAAQHEAANRKTRTAWERPPCPAIDPSAQDITFQQLEVDYYIGNPHKNMPGSRQSPVPIIRMFGLTMEGHSVCAHIHGFTPYFYVPAPKGFTTDHCETFRKDLDTVVLRDMKSNKDNVRVAVLAVEVQMKESIQGYHGNQKVQFLKIMVALPKLIAPAKRLLESGFFTSEFGERGYQTYESNVDFEIRFMCDMNVVGCNWIGIPARKYSIHSNSGQNSCVTRCQIEIDVSFEEFMSHPAEGDWQKIAPLRILSFDIECAGRRGIFPEPEKDPVIQIANMVIVQGEKDPFVRNVFCLKSCAQVAGHEILSFENEAQLLQVAKSSVFMSVFVCLSVCFSTTMPLS